MAGFSQECLKVGAGHDSGRTVAWRAPSPSPLPTPRPPFSLRSAPQNFCESGGTLASVAPSAAEVAAAGAAAAEEARKNAEAAAWEQLAKTLAKPRYDRVRKVLADTLRATRCLRRQWRRRWPGQLRGRHLAATRHQLSPARPPAVRALRERAHLLSPACVATGRRALEFPIRLGETRASGGILRERRSKFARLT